MKRLEEEATATTEELRQMGATMKEMFALMKTMDDTRKTKRMTSLDLLPKPVDSLEEFEALCQRLDSESGFRVKLVSKNLESITLFRFAI